MNKSLRFMAVPTLALAALALSGSPAMAADQSYQSTLGQLNGSAGAGTITVDVTGNQAHVVLKVSGMP
ncbi:hypothetical protein NG702_17735, partial [Pseudarthrobacter sp. MDT3-28]|nr:hypothetical protein [Pseudarthrobacter sp. MDT3-28]